MSVWQQEVSLNAVPQRVHSCVMSIEYCTQKLKEQGSPADSAVRLSCRTAALV